LLLLWFTVYHAISPGKRVLLGLKETDLNAVDSDPIFLLEFQISSWITQSSL